ncbi:hypothetical protein [Ramlibacter sp. AN1133]|uniref:hypothetical protein n=1 Tax=Ramlibacter sp. AN1133 TaxID=3133429 RepID=UPI0030C5E39D
MELMLLQDLHEPRSIRTALRERRGARLRTASALSLVRRLDSVENVGKLENSSLRTVCACWMA